MNAVDLIAKAGELVGGDRAEPHRRRLLAKIKIDGRSCCWNWTASKFHDGYGCFSMGGKTYRAHRTSYEFHCGPIPDGLQVLHRCDNPACINPKHLFLGTNLENVADKLAKDRQPRGRTHGRSKLTEADVIAIRTASGPRGLQAKLARQYRIGEYIISAIRRGKLWSHIAEGNSK